MHKPRWAVKTAYGFLALVLAISLVIVAAPVGATGSPTLTKTITADGLEVDCDNPMSGEVKFVFTYDPGDNTTAVDHMVIIITGPTPYIAAQPINLLLDASGNFSTGSMESMMEMGIVDRNDDGELDVGTDPADDIIFIPGDSSAGEVTTVTFWLNTEKNWSQDTDDLIMPGYEGIDPDWDRPAHTSVWPMGPCTDDHSGGQYNIVAEVYGGGDPLASVDQDDPLYNDPYMLPSLGVDVKGSIQCFYAKNTGPDSIVEWTVLPGVNSPIVVIEGGGLIHQDWICVASAKPGDAIVKAYIDTDESGVADLVISGEKKWGDIHHTELEADKTANIVDGDEVDIDEMVYATIHWGSMDPDDEVVLSAGGALVHWWLINNTGDENQALLIDLLEGIFPGTVTDEHPYYEICGTYDDPDNPYALLDAFATLHAATDTEFVAVEGVAVDGGTLTYVSSVTDDSIIPPDVKRGWTGTTVEFTANPVTLETEEVMVVLLAEYPLINMFHGENPVCVEFVKLTPKPEVTEVQPKTPQVAWAGEKLVIEKKWGKQFTGQAVTFQLDEDSIGTLLGVSNFTMDHGIVETYVGSDGIARCIIESEYEGQAEVKCTLWGKSSVVIANHDFPVFFLKLESIEVLPESELLPDVEDEGLVGVQVKGWFTTKSSDLSSRPASWLDLDPNEDCTNPGVEGANDGIPNNDHEVVLPAGRWVLPDDWPTLAGEFQLRTHWDLADNNTDLIMATNPFGSFDGAVYTPAPGIASKNVVGPFNTTQPFGVDPADGALKWIATATVVGDDDLVTPDDARCTVVPNGVIEWEDCPMPPALVYFQADGTDTLLIQAMKGLVPDYGFVDPVTLVRHYTWPFYFYEIPSSQFIPVGGIPEGYYWDSWGVWTATATDDGAYEFWTDLGVTVGEMAARSLEVYTDNNGRAYVQVGEPTGQNSVVVSAIVDYPYQRKHPAVWAENVVVTWGEVTDCEDSPPIEVGLESILADPARRVVVYHEWGGAWTGYDTAAPAGDNDLTMLEAGKGYWISASTDCTLDYYCNVHVLTGGLWYMIGWQDCCVD